MPPNQITPAHKKQTERMGDAYVGYSDPERDVDLEAELKTRNPIHQSTTTIDTRAFDEIGNFYDKMGSGEDMDWYQKLVRGYGGKAIKNTKLKVLRGEEDRK